MDALDFSDYLVLFIGLILSITIIGSIALIGVVTFVLMWRRVRRRRPWRADVTKVKSEAFVCGRCYDEVEKLYPANCAEHPESRHQALGMYHCYDCGAMLLASLPHPDLCARCISRVHPEFDKAGSGPPTYRKAS